MSDYDVKNYTPEGELEPERSYLPGIIGALLGAALGAAVWAFVLKMGYVAALVGLLIGFLAVKGYDLLKGKQDKLKIVIIILAVIAGVAGGTVGGYYLQYLDAVEAGQLAPDSFGLLMDFLTADSEFYIEILKGLAFSALGVYGLLRSEFQKLAQKKDNQQ